MKQLLIFFLFLFTAGTVTAQLRCYKGDFQSVQDLRFRIDRGQLYLQTSTFREVEYLFAEGNVVYFGRKGDRMHPLYTLHDNQIFRGNSTMSTDLLYTIYEKGIYPGRSTVFSDCLFTVSDGKVFKGKSDASFDLLMSCDKAVLSNEEYLLLVAAILPY